MNSVVEAIKWDGESLILIDQRLLPEQEVYLAYETSHGVVEAITEMVVRGAPAIGICAAYGVVLAANAGFRDHGVEWKAAIAESIQSLAQSRPTAVNLFWALERMGRLIETLDSQQDPVPSLRSEAEAIHQEDIAANRVMGQLGSDIMARTADRPFAVLTHCNTGSLATGGFGTALGVIRHAWQDSVISQVFADETRPWLQGSRLTAWELSKDNIPVKLNADAAAAHIMKQGHVKWVIVGADRIAANGDAANKIGTYSLAVIARHHGVKFMVVAPSTTVDMSLSSGDLIPIEERTGSEVTSLKGHRLAPEGVAAYNPVFDVTPAELIDVIITEKGAIEQPSTQKMVKIFGKKVS